MQDAQLKDVCDKLTPVVLYIQGAFVLIQEYKPEFKQTF
jgi:hypothetical protein